MGGRTGRLRSSGRQPFGYYEGFFLAEPEANAFVRMNEHLRVVGGVGYRFVGAEGHDDHRLSGVTGSLGLQIF